MKFDLRGALNTHRLTLTERAQDQNFINRASVAAAKLRFHIFLDTAEVSAPDRINAGKFRLRALFEMQNKILKFQAQARLYAFAK